MLVQYAYQTSAANRLKNKQQYSTLFLLLLLFKKAGNATLGESDYPISPKTPAPLYQPIEWKKKRGQQ